jgi:hypothetical protein
MAMSTKLHWSDAPGVMIGDAVGSEVIVLMMFWSCNHIAADR